MKNIYKKTLLAALLLLLTVTAAFAQDWPMFRSDAMRTGTVPTEHAFANFTGQKDWTVKIPDAIQSSPAIYGSLAIFGSNNGYVYALDLSTGSTVWTFHTENWVASSPSVVDGKVFVGSYDSRLYCINAATGGMSIPGLM